jgi:hypothetical protein
MANSVTFPLTNHTYTDDSDPNTGLDGGGHVLRFVPALSDVVTAAAGVQDTIAQGISQINAIAATVTQSASTAGTFTATLTLAKGSLSITLGQTYKAFSIGQTVNIADSTGVHVMSGPITAFTTATGAMSINVTTLLGSGTYTSTWTVSVGAAMPGAITFPPDIDQVGYMNMPQNSQSANYTLTYADQGKHIYHPMADTTPRTFTIPTHASMATKFPNGTVITIINDTNAGVITITTADTLILAGTGTAGDRTISANGIATLTKMTDTRWIIAGSGVL